MYYLSSRTVLEAFKRLQNVEIESENILFIFFILKACGINDIIPTDVDIIKQNGHESTFKLSSLFGPNEQFPEKCDFLNPFHLNSWANMPTEGIYKYVAGRIKNNIIAGGSQWRKILNYDSDDDKIKFTYNYLDEVSLLCLQNGKIDLQALVIWVSRFNVYPEKPSIYSIIQDFKELFKLSDPEMSKLFNNIGSIAIEFSASLFDTRALRNLIQPETDIDGWLIPEIIEDGNNFLRSQSMLEAQNVTESNVTAAKILEALNIFNNVMLSGPPATSKSFFSNEISESYDSSLSIQFHPEYSYQDFIGGYFVEGDKVIFQKGALSLYCEEATSNPSKKFLLIIDEVNRGNLSAILGEAIQCLDRGYTTHIKIGGENFSLNIPNNLHILATRNTTDKSLSNIDLAVFRRFIEFRIFPDAEILTEICVIEGGISARDLLIKLNRDLVRVTEDVDMQIGHALFLNPSIKKTDNTYYWSKANFRMLFTHSIIPLVREYCQGDTEKFSLIFSSILLSSQGTENFENAVSDYILSD